MHPEGKMDIFAFTTLMSRISVQDLMVILSRKRTDRLARFMIEPIEIA